MTFNELKRFIDTEMRMSQVYQPVMLIELLQRNGKASVTEIARAILDRDPTQIEYYAEIVKNMVGRVLTKSREITIKVGQSYELTGFDKLDHEQVQYLIELCQTKIESFENKRGGSVWAHRKRNHRPISGSVRFEVFKRARFHCELCGTSAEQRSLEVDHILPKSLGGPDDLANYQALCYSCNAAKRNTDSTDFRQNKDLMATRQTGCLFCEIQSNDRLRIMDENSLAYAIHDAFPVTQGHTLVIPKRHVIDYFGLLRAELGAIDDLIHKQRQLLQTSDAKITGFNIGMNCAESAGQTIFHCHVHLIPRRDGDVINPRGGVRHVIPGKGTY